MNFINGDTIENSVNAVLNTNYKPKGELDYDSSAGNMEASIANNTLHIALKNTILQIGKTKVSLLNDSGYVSSILNKSLATKIINNSSLARWLTTAPSKSPKTFGNESIPVFGMMQTPIKCKSWRIEDSHFPVLKDVLKPLICRDLFDELGISVIKTLNSIAGNMINNFKNQCPLKNKTKYLSPNLISCIGRSKLHIVKSKFYKHFQPKHQKGGRVPTNS